MTNYGILALWAVCFLLCNLGYWEFFRRNTSIDPSYHPGLTAACQISVLFFAGILHCLPEAAACLWIAGIGYLLFSLWKDKSLAFLRAYLRPCYLLLAIFAGVILLRVYDCILTEYDNFTHWGIVLKTMLAGNRFPDFRDTAITFQAYPLGSSIYLYFGLCFPGIGMVEWIAMFLQSFLEATLLIPLCSRIRKNHLAGMLFLLSAGICFIGNGMRDLRVDILLAIASSAMLLYIQDYCLTEKAGKTQLWLASAFLVAVVQLKNSALLFVAMGIVGILWQGKKDGQWKTRILVCLVPLLSFFLWRKHFGNVYYSAETSYHAMTLKNYMFTFFNNPISAIPSVAVDVFRFSLTYVRSWYCLACLMLATGVTCWQAKQRKPLLKRLLLFAAVFYGCYQLGMLGMYIFSMGTVESQGLPGSPRYTNAALIVINYMLCSLCLRVLSDLDAKKSKSLACICLLVLMYPVRTLAGEERPSLTRPGAEVTEARRSIEQLVETYRIPEGKSYAVLVPENDTAYRTYVLRYVLSTGQAKTVYNADRETLDSLTEDYLIILDSDNPNIQPWIADHYPDQLCNQVISTSN